MQNQHPAMAMSKFIVLCSAEKIHVAKESEFSFFLRSASLQTLESLKQTLHETLKEYGEQRNPGADLLRMRLNQVRATLQAA
jgi:hypothetical protein